ncbi:MAG: hypothetical protein CMP23_08860 [Rickettsiales bacterium]|nr:hypothetical protein [Rickettsiales bacterium]
MLSRTLLLSTFFATLSACQPPPQAPTELGELSLYLFANFDDPNPLVMQAGVVNMLAFLEEFEASADLGMDSSPADRAWQLPVLEAQHWGGAEHWSGHQPLDQLPVAVAARSAFSGLQHAELVGLADQTPIESASSARYDRSFLSAFGPWINGEEAALRTSNSIDRDNLLLTLTYTSLKDYRWVDLPEGGGQAAVARSWITQQYINEPGAGTDGEDSLDFFSNMEITIPSGSGTLRYNALWGAVKLVPAIDDTILINTVRNGLQEGYENTESYLEAS